MRVTPFVLGMSRVKTRIFAILNACSALLWAVVVGTGGFIFGRALQILLGDMRRYELRVILCIVGIGLGLWLFHVFKKRSAAPKTTECRSGKV